MTVGGLSFKPKNLPKASFDPVVEVELMYGLVMALLLPFVHNDSWLGILNASDDKSCHITRLGIVVERRDRLK